MPAIISSVYISKGIEELGSAADVTILKEKKKMIWDHLKCLGVKLVSKTCQHNLTRGNKDIGPPMNMCGWILHYNVVFCSVCVGFYFLAIKGSSARWETSLQLLPLAIMEV